VDTLPNLADTLRQLTDAYTSALSVMTRALEGLPRQDGEAYRRLAEQWLRLARMSKDGFVTAIEQGFELWERECRRALEASTAGPSSRPAPNPLEAWAENWKKTLEAATAASPAGEAGSAEMRKQAEAFQRTMQESLAAWQRLWQPPERKG
jgi:hypothetical protein